jgi:DNA-binding transcriptional regulator LsrR (DeoR family)
MSRAESARLRAAWLYHHHQCTQTEVAERLGVSRATVIRMLEEVSKRKEVQVWINDSVDECIGLAIELENAFGLDRALVAPSSDNPTRAVAAMLGQYLTENIADGMNVGIGWGRTLTAALQEVVPNRLPNALIVSLMGGLINPSRQNPIEVSWRLASLLDAECLLYLAPIFVDSVATREVLEQQCGLDEINKAAANLDMAVVSCGDIGTRGTSLAKGIVGKSVHSELVNAGAVADVMCNFIDQDGEPVPHPISSRTMSVDLGTVSSAKNLVLASGGQHRAKALLASLRCLSTNTLITDEDAATALLKMNEKTK